MHPLRTQTEGFRTDNSDLTQSQVRQLDHLDPTQTPQSPIALHRHHTMKKRVRGKKNNRLQEVHSSSNANAFHTTTNYTSPILKASFKIKGNDQLLRHGYSIMRCICSLMGYVLCLLPSKPLSRSPIQQQDLTSHLQLPSHSSSTH